MTLREALLYGKDFLQKSEIEEYETDAWLLLEGACGCTRNDYYMRGETPLTEEEETLFLDGLKKRSKRIPVQHILGTQEFMGLTFRVTPDVLIPRQDTETLVEEVLKVVKPGNRILDLCTGSGCILLSVLHYAKECAGTGADLSEAALCVAEENARALGIDAAFVHTNLFEKIEGRYDVIVSNPPYIATEEIETLMPEVRKMEPRMALDGGADGLVFYRKIVAASKNYLNPGGRLLFEIGCSQGRDVAEMMNAAGFGEIQVKKDLAGLDRVVSGKMEERNV